MMLEQVVFYMAFVYPLMTALVGVWAFALLRAYALTHDPHALTQGIALALGALAFASISYMTLVNSVLLTRFIVRLFMWLTLIAMLIDFWGIWLGEENQK